MKRARVNDAAQTDADAALGLVLFRRTKTIHFVRHAEGVHNTVPPDPDGIFRHVVHTTPGAWQYQDAKLTPSGVQQCADRRGDGLAGEWPGLVVVSPLTRALQTAHLLFGGAGAAAGSTMAMGTGGAPSKSSTCAAPPPFVVSDLCRERTGLYTCDKRRCRNDVVQEVGPLFAATEDTIDFTTHGFQTEEDHDWGRLGAGVREPAPACSARAMALLRWLASRPEQTIAVVTHNSFLRHLFAAFDPGAVGGDSSHGDKGLSLALPPMCPPALPEDERAEFRRKLGTAEIRTVLLFPARPARRPARRR